jgi:hypothetical protein
MIFGRAKVLEVELALTKEALERVREDYAGLKADYARLIDQMGNLVGGRPLQKTDWELDPYAENAKLPDEWLSPGPNELAIDIAPIEEKLGSEDLT